MWNMCTFHGIDIWNLESVDDYYVFSISRKNLSDFESLCQKTDVVHDVILEAGIPCLAGRIKKNLTFFLGAGLALAIMFLLSQLIWSIKIMGNSGYGKEEILRFLENCEVTHGMRKQKIVCSSLAASLREAFPNITWVTVRINGTNLIVEMKENILDEDRTQEKSNGPSNLICEKDGVIVHMITRSGTPLYSVGMECKKGDILVEGIVPIYNDSQEVVRYEYVDSDADIKIRTVYSYYDEFSMIYEKETLLNKESTHFFQIGKWRIGLPYDSPVSDTQKKIRESQQFSLTDTFFLPFFYGQEEILSYEKEEEKYTAQQARSLANQHLSRFLSDLEKKGVQIYENNVKIVMSDAKCIAKGEIIVIETIGKNSPFSPDDIVSAQIQEE